MISLIFHQLPRKNHLKQNFIFNKIKIESDDFEIFFFESDPF
jgi:hypothetical protein